LQIEPISDLQLQKESGTYIPLASNPLSPQNAHRTHAGQDPCPPVPNAACPPRRRAENVCDTQGLLTSARCPQLSSRQPPVADVAAIGNAP
jgi:hypothetical protein